MVIIYIIFSLLEAFLGTQISLRELKLFSGKYNYRISVFQWVSLFFFIIFCVTLVSDFLVKGIVATVFGMAAVSILAFIKEWVWSKVNTSTLLFSLIYHIIVISISATFLYNSNEVFLSLPFIWGVYFRNCPFGVVHGKPLFISSWFKKYRRSKIEKTYRKENLNVVGFDLKQYAVTDYDIKPYDRKDQTENLQKLIDNVGRNGGGIILFPKGKYYFDNFIQINYSNITLNGEVDEGGNPLAELVLRRTTVYGKRNPWLSPFFITTGEIIQKSNIFWGLQFRKKKNIITRSGSLADPGSNGEILTPKFATKIIKPSNKGENKLYVEDSSVVGKYILLGLYNTTKDGNLIKDILGVDNLRKEWGTARRAGEEEAPSYQWLIEITNIIDDHTIEVSEPLFRDCDMKYTPEVYNVEMIENIQIMNLMLNTKWNGMFRHHGFPLYYSIEQSQAMDYGWNGINMKRVAHGIIENVVFKNFTNPLYVMDSRNILSRHLEIRGYDGHQGIKIYEHACNNTFEDIVFFNHYADMLGGEGNAYGNVFSNIYYMNPCFRPVDFDFHGFSEGPMSPPANNLFIGISGFRHIKTAGALYNMPGCAQYNKWKDIISEGEKMGDPLFISLPYMPKQGVFKTISAIRHSFVMAAQHKKFSFAYIRQSYKARIKEMNDDYIPVSKHWIFYKHCILENYTTYSTYPKDEFVLLSTSQS